VDKSYRIHFRNERGWIEACEDFRADSHQSALVIAAWLFDGCSDCCADYDLWCGKTRLGDGAEPGYTGTPLTMRMHMSLQKTAETMLNGKWKLAQSARLSALIAQLKRPTTEIAFDRSPRADIAGRDTADFRA
jgi:hypothetical protein